jgi:predicted Ser/Thr protein kinase
VTPDPSAGPGSSRPRPAPEQWARIKELFQQALDQPAGERRSWLAATAGSDAELFREVDSLLAAHETGGQFLREPPAVAPANVQILSPGTHLGSYEILDELGRGGGGIVYLARDHRLGRQVALKLVATGANPEQRDRLRREARAAATISHPSVATVHTLEEFDEQLFIVSEYVRGRTLRTMLADGPLPRERAAAIALDMAKALRAAHEAGVIHRDLKPENVLLSDTGAVKIVDFGIARIADDAVTQLTRHGALLGTPAYMAPEQLLGAVVDARADIYAFGIVLIEMLTGRHPAATATGGAQAPEGELLQVARLATQLDPGARYQSAAALVEALDHLDRSPAARRATARWWWEFHQVAAAIVYGLTLWPTWIARSSVGGSTGRIFFIVILAAVVMSAVLRLHMWFTSRFYTDELAWVRSRSKRWIRGADAVFSAGLVGGGLLFRAEHSSLDVLLLSIGIGAGVASLFVESATTRAAFGKNG